MIRPATPRANNEWRRNQGTNGDRVRVGPIAVSSSGGRSEREKGDRENMSDIPVAANYKVYVEGCRS